MDKISPYILIADDDPDDLLIFISAFQQNHPGLHARVFDDGDGILNFLSAEQGRLPELIVLDYKMPRVSGAEVLRQLSVAEGYKSIPVIVWSTSERKKEANECRELGAVDFFVKPADQEGLIRMIGQIGEILETAHSNIGR